MLARFELSGVQFFAEKAPLQAERASLPFHWSQVESTNYLEYITNLRRIGCPEQTVRDIIVADVNQLFAPRYAALSTTAPELVWWGRFDKEHPARPELAAQLRALDAERKFILGQLLGTDSMDLPFAEATVAAIRDENVYEFLPVPKQTAVREVLSRHQAALDLAEAEGKSLPTDEWDAKAKLLREARSRELTALLTSEELHEFELRDSSTSDGLRELYGRADLSEAEFRKLFDLCRDFEQRVARPKRDDWKQLESDYATALGLERFGEIQRQNDSLWRAMRTLSQEHNLSADAMERAYALQQEYVEKLVQAVGRMFADPAQDPQPVRDIAAERDARLTAILGVSTLRHLDRLGVLPRLVVQDDGQRKIYGLSRAAFSE
jgi:hypothetical protein